MSEPFKMPAAQRQAVIFTLLCVFPLVGMVVDLVAPSLPAITHALQASESSAQNVISFYLLGFAAGNFIAGVLTDALGRRTLLLVGLFGFVLMSLLPVVWPNMVVLLAARFLQGLTVGAVAVVSRATGTDILPTAQLVKFGTLTGSMFALGPVVGPVLGGYLQVWFGWQAGFVFLAIGMAVMLVLIYFIVPETHFNRHPLNWPTLRKNFSKVLASREFVGLVLLMGAIYSLTISFNTVGPFLIQVRLHHSPIFFGHLALFLGCVFLVSTFICRWLIHHYEVARIQVMAIALLLLVTLLGAVIGSFFPNNLMILCLMSALVFFSQGILFPSAMGRGMALFRHIAGTATALMYLINISMTSLSGFVLSLLPHTDSRMLLWVYLILATIAALAYWRLVHRRHG